MCVPKDGEPLLPCLPFPALLPKWCFFLTCYALGHTHTWLPSGKHARIGPVSFLRMSSSSSGRVTRPVSRSQTPMFNLDVAHWESGSPAWGWELEVPEGRNPPVPTLILNAHTETQSHSHVHRMSHRRTRGATHSLSPTKSHAGVWRIGAGSRRRLRKHPQSSPSLLLATPLLPHAVPAPGAAWPRPGNSSASRRLQAPRNPILTQP